MRENARQEYLSRYTADANYEMLRAIYGRALGGSANAPSAQEMSEVAEYGPLRTQETLAAPLIRR